MTNESSLSTFRVTFSPIDSYPKIVLKPPELNKCKTHGMLFPTPLPSGPVTFTIFHYRFGAVPATYAPWTTGCLENFGERTVRTPIPLALRERARCVCVIMEVSLRKLREEVAWFGMEVYWFDFINGMNGWIW